MNDLTAHGLFWQHHLFKQPAKNAEPQSHRQSSPNHFHILPATKLLGPGQHFSIGSPANWAKPGPWHANKAKGHWIISTAKAHSLSTMTISNNLGIEQDKTGLTKSNKLVIIELFL